MAEAASATADALVGASGWTSGYDIVMHCNDQSRCSRLVSYFNDPSLTLFPEAFADEAVAFAASGPCNVEQVPQAVELGPSKRRSGPQLVLIRPIRWTPEYLIQWFSGHSLLRRHVSRLFLFDPLVPKEGSSAQGGQQWFSGHPVLRRHVSRLFLFDPLVPKEGSRDDLISAIGRHGMPKGCSAMRMHCNPRSMQTELCDALEVHGFSWHPVHYSHALMVVVADEAVHKIDESLIVTGHLSGAGQVTRHLDTVDAVVSDMNLRPLATVEIFMSLVPYLQPGGLAIITLKYTFFCKGKGHSDMLALMTAAFDDLFEDHKVVWLLANTVNEATYIARKRLVPRQRGRSVKEAGRSIEEARKGANEACQ
eukprot:gene24506-10104_t